ncbi:MAG: MG2 domain-containing protein [Bacteroidota bacterium]
MPIFLHFYRPYGLVFSLLLLLNGCFSPARLTDAPEGEVSARGSLTFKFNVPLAPEDSLDEWIFRDLVQFEPSIAGGYKWSDPQTLRFTPTEALKPAWHYTAVVQPAALMGKRMGADFDTLRFHTPLFEPRAISVSWPPPSHRALRSPVRIEVTFSHPVEPSEALKHLELYHQGKRIEQLQLESYRRDSRLQLLLDADELAPGKLEFEVRCRAGLPSTLPHAQLNRDITFKETLAPVKSLLIRTVKHRIEDGRITVTIETNQPVDPKALRSYLKLTPEMDFGLEKDGPRIRIRADFKPGRLVNVSIRKGLGGLRGGLLERDFTYNLMLPGLDPFARFSDNQGHYLMRNGAENLNVKTVNTPYIVVRLHEIYANNLLHFLNGNRYTFAQNNYYRNARDYFYSYGSEVNIRNNGRLIAEDTISLEEAPENEPFNVAVNLQKRLRSNYKGIFTVELVKPDEFWPTDAKIVSLSDLGLIAKRTDDEILVFVNALSTARPVPGVTVRVISATNQQVLTATTDGQGIARFTGLENRLSTGRGRWEPRLITASTGNDFNFLDLRSMAVEDWRRETAGRPYRETEAFLYGERDLYRPGDTAHFAAILRSWEMAPIRNRPLRFQVTGPNGTVLADRKKVSDSEGSLEFSVPIPAESRTGWYRAEVQTTSDVTLATYSFNVEEFVPDKIKVDLDRLAPTGLPGDTLRFPLAAAYYFGSPCAEHRYDYRFSFRKLRFYSRKYPDFRFDTDENRHSELQDYEGSGQLSAAGTDTLQFEIPSDLNALERRQGTLFTTVFDNTGRTVSRRTRFQIRAQGIFLGVQARGRIFSVNDNYEFDVVAVNDQDIFAAGEEVVVTVQRYDWTNSLRRRAGNYNYVSEANPITLRKDTIVLGNGPYRYRMRLRDAGNYRIKVRRLAAPGQVHKLKFSAYGRDVATAGSFEVDREGDIAIIADRDNYRVGETARLLFTTPFSGRMLVTVERDRVYRHYYLNVEKNSAELRLPLNVDMLPNVIVSATLFRPQRNTRTLPMTVAHGEISLKVDDSRRQLPIRIAAPDQVKPGTTAKVTVRTAARRDIRVTVAIVDEGILAMKNYATPDPFTYLYAARRNRVRNYDLYKFLLPEVPSAQGATGGGSGYNTDGGTLLNPVQAQRFRALASWSGILRTDAAGRATTEIDIPKEFNGRARIMAVAWQGKRFGSGDAPLIIKDDVVMLEGVPRFATAGDTLVVPVDLLNTTESAGKAQVELQVEGPLRVVGRPQVAIDLTAQGSGTGEFKVIAQPEIGVGKLRFSLSGLETAVHDYELAVRPPAPFERESGSGVIPAGSSVQIALPDGYYPGLHNTRLIISRLPVTEFASDLEYLLRYPHGCAEQTTSAVFPQLYYPKLAEIVAPERFQSSNAVHNVRQGIYRLESMQLYHGGFAYWPGGSYANEWASTYVTHFLVEAQKAGYPVNSSTIENALGFLAKFAAEKATFTYHYLKDEDGQTGERVKKEVIYALYVLALAGDPDISLMNYYRDHPELMTRDSRYLLGTAFALAGDVGSLEQLLPSTWRAERAVRLTGGSFDSPIRANAMVLTALVEADPDHPHVESSLRYLVENRKRIYSTQDRVWAFLAIGKALSSEGLKHPKVSVAVDGQPERTFSGEPFRLAGQDLLGKTITLTATGEGKAWYSWQVGGIRQGTGVRARDRDEKLRVRRKWYDPEGRPYQRPLFHQGDLVVCTVELTAEQDADNLAITDMIPAGFEVENLRLKGDQFTWIKNLGRSQHADVRDDRVLHYLSARANATRKLSFLVRAVSRGSYLLPPLAAEAMYDPAINSVQSGDTVYIYPLSAELPEDRLGPLPTPKGQGKGAESTQMDQSLWTRLRNNIRPTTAN